MQKATQCAILAAMKLQLGHLLSTKKDLPLERKRTVYIINKIHLAAESAISKVKPQPLSVHFSLFSFSFPLSSLVA